MTSSAPASPYKLQVVIMSRNRLEYLVECLESLLNQDDTNFHLVISDNSDTYEVINFINKKYPSITLIKREPILTAISHFNKIIDECESEYIIVFHDDDFVETDYISKIKQVWRKNKNYSAIGTNAKLVRGRRITERKFFEQKDVEFKSQHELFQRYCSLHRINIAPFPSYCYNVKFIKNQQYLENTGKYNDLLLLLNLVNSGNILWIGDCYMYYRVHARNDSRIESIKERKVVLNYISSHLKMDRHNDLVKIYRYKYMKCIAAQSINNPKKAMISVIFKRRWRLYILFKIFIMLNFRSIFKTA